MSSQTTEVKEQPDGRVNQLEVTALLLGLKLRHSGVGTAKPTVHLSVPGLSHCPEPELSQQL